MSIYVRCSRELLATLVLGGAWLWAKFWQWVFELWSIDTGA